MKLNDLLEFLKGKGFKVQHNEEAQTFEVEPPPAAEPIAAATLSEEDVKALKALAGSAGALQGMLAAVPTITQVAQNAQAAETARRAELSGSIKANSTLFDDSDLAGMSLAQLTKLNAQVSVNFAGAGGGYTQQNSTAVESLGLPESFATQKEK